MRATNPRPVVLCGTLLVSICSIANAASPLVRPTVYVLDLRSSTNLPAAERYDLRHAAVCIQGIANRDAPRAFTLFTSEDAWWLTRLGEPGGLCEGWPVVYVTDFDAWLARFRARIKGVVLYDPDPNTGVISTSLAATTAAGVLDAIAVRKDTASGSMYRKLVLDATGPQLPVLVDLAGKFTGSGTIWQTGTPSTGSAKCDAYIWAKEKYLDTGLCDPTVLVYTLDLWGLKLGLGLQTQLNNLDFGISRRGFCFELSPWGDETPNDDAGQPVGTDLVTFKAIMHACNQRTAQQRWIKLCGFINWPYKYTDHTGGNHGDVATEWEMVRLVSAYNVFLEADAPSPQWVSNTSFYGGLTRAVALRRHIQNPAPTFEQLQARGLIGADGRVPDGNYIMLGMGDYDQASWVLNVLAPSRYNSAARGQVDCNWAVDPNMADRASVAFDYMFRHKSPRDTFMAWDSGAGYVNPRQLRGTRSPSGYPSGVNTWREHCKHYYRMFDYSITAWLLNGNAGTLNSTDFRNYAPFSGDGIGHDGGTPGGPALDQNVPIRARNGPDNPAAGQLIDATSGVNFAWYRTILWTPDGVKALADAYAGSGHNHQFVDAYSFYYLMRHHLGGNNDHRATWVSDSIPRIMRAGETIPVEITVRNDGWDNWSEAAAYRLGIAIVPPGAAPAYVDYDARGRGKLPDGTVVRPGESGVFSHAITAPVSPGTYDLYYDLVHDGVTWFREVHNLEWKQTLIVASDPLTVDTDGDALPDTWETANGRLFWHPDDGTPGPASSPLPADGSANAARMLSLQWTPGFAADSHVVYLARTPPDTASAPLAESQASTVVVGPLLGGTTYFWRVDERNPIGLTTGEAWRFTTGGVRADLDADNDVDLEDFGLLQACLTGSVGLLEDPACTPADLDDDQRVERNDIAIFLGCLSGPGMPPDPLCHPGRP